MALGLFLVLLGLTYTFRHLIVSLPANMLTIPEALPKEVDVIFVMPGDFVGRSLRAAELYKAGTAKEIWVPNSPLGDLEAMGLVPSQQHLQVLFLERLGVPRKAVRVLQDQVSSSTIEDAIALRNQVMRENRKHILVVTSWYHSRRAAWVMQNVLNDTGVKVDFALAWGTESPYRHWWRSESSVLTMYNEYLKWAYYLYKYGIRGFPKEKAKNPVSYVPGNAYDKGLACPKSS